MSHTLDTNAFDLTSFLQNLPNSAGCYLMHNHQAEVIYVGKAKNLKRRVGSYFAKDQDHPKTRAMVAQVAYIEIMLTQSEAEAFILEYTLIKKHTPRYNIIFRDDKSYPYIYVTTQHAFPSLSFYRGARKKEGRLFGPFPSAPAVHETLNMLQKIFPVRQCTDSFFRNRARPCLQYEIKRCTAPCVGLISESEYDKDVQDTLAFLEGKSQTVIQRKEAEMLAAAESLAFERAASLRDQIQYLQQIQQKQFVSADTTEDTDIICLMQDDQQQTVVQLLMVRNGNVWGASQHFPKHAQEADTAVILSAFLLQHYAGREIPGKLILSHPIDDQEGLQDWLKWQSNQRIQLVFNPRGHALKWMQLAQNNARQALLQRHLNQTQQQQLLKGLQEKLKLPRMAKHMVCFDISHLQGTQTVASEAVFIDGVASKSHYRRYNITGITPGDDPAAMRQVLHRRLKRAQQNDDYPDLIIVDGGRVQLRMAYEQLRELNIADDQIMLLAIAKGEGRKAGLETFYRHYDEEGVQLSPDDPVAHLLQRIRDEAHRFAITGQRQSRKKGLNSALEEIPGIGAKTKTRLLKAFANMQNIQAASVEQLSSVEGITQKQAETIYQWFHETP